MKTSNAMKILNKDVGHDAELREMIAQEKVDLHVSRLIHDARTATGLTQSELAKLIDSKQPVIAKLEDADYDGHSLSMLRRIADALNMKLTIDFIPADPNTLQTN
jgi:ribosome-binding protein aMBF1 (putative translation factor)